MHKIDDRLEVGLKLTHFISKHYYCTALQFNYTEVNLIPRRELRGRKLDPFYMHAVQQHAFIVQSE